MKIKAGNTSSPIPKKKPPSISETNRLITELLMKSSAEGLKSEPIIKNNIEKKPAAKRKPVKEPAMKKKVELEPEDTSHKIEKDNLETMNQENEDNEMRNVNLAGLSEKEYFIEKQNIEEDNICSFDKKDFYISNVTWDGNSGYRALALQIFGNEENYREIRRAIYTCLANNKENISKFFFERDGKALSGDEYLKYVKMDNEEIGDLEVATLEFLFNAEIFLFQLREDGKIYLLNEIDRIDDKEEDKIFLNLCLVKGCQYQVIYEKNRDRNFFCNKDELVETIEKNIKKQDSLKIKLEYTKDKRLARYIDIENYIISKMLNTSEGNYPPFICNMEDETKKRNRKKIFRELAKKYFVDEKTGRLKLSFNISCKSDNKDVKEFFVVYKFEKINIVRRMHEKVAHSAKKPKTLDEIVKDLDFWWYRIYQDIKKYATSCPLCHKKKLKD